MVITGPRGNKMIRIRNDNKFEKIFLRMNILFGLKKPKSGDILKIRGFLFKIGLYYGTNILWNNTVKRLIISACLF